MRTRLAALLGAVALLFTAAPAANADAGPLETLGDIQVYSLTFCRDGLAFTQIGAIGTPTTTATSLQAQIKLDGVVAVGFTQSLPTPPPQGLSPAVAVGRPISGTSWEYSVTFSLSKADGTLERAEWTATGNCDAPQGSTTTQVLSMDKTCEGYLELQKSTTVMYTYVDFLYQITSTTGDPVLVKVQDLTKDEAKVLKCQPYGSYVKPGKK